MSTSKLGNFLQSDALEKTERIMELFSRKLGENNEPDVTPKQVKICDKTFCDTIYLLFGDMPEGEVKDMVQMDVHQLNVKGKYRLSAQGNFEENQMQRKNNHSQRMLSSPNSHIHLPAGNPHKYSCPIPCYIQHLVFKRVSERNIFFCMFFGSIL